MSVWSDPQQQTGLATSCGTLVINARQELLLCHVTGANRWDIPKGLQDPGESTLEAASRELREETGLQFNTALFTEIGRFDYQDDKCLFLYKLYAPVSLDNLDHLVCSSYFTHHVSGKLLPEMDGYRWASRHEIRDLCGTRMSRRLLSIAW